MKRIGVLTSGGDAPGMNAAIRAVVRTGLSQGWEVMGIRNGYSGLCNNNMAAMGARDVSGIIQHGGTALGSARCHEFLTEEGRRKALHNLEERAVEALVIIGGNGSQTGAHALSQMGFPVVGVASTIDNDLYGSEITIGVDTALDVALVAIDQLKVTASSHHRAFIVEVMGRDCGYLALVTGITGGAEYIVIPEFEIDAEDVVNAIRLAYERGKAHALIIVAEGARYNARGLENYFAKHHADTGFDLRITTLGHVQRGGTPGAFDRLLATRLGAAATEYIAQGKFGVLAGLTRGQITPTPLAEVVTGEKPLDLNLLRLSEVLNTQ
jgi:6-phosphofructokinase 1